MWVDFFFTSFIFCLVSLRLAFLIYHPVADLAVRPAAESGQTVKKSQK
jgi:hypothetical protein